VISTSIAEEPKYKCIGPYICGDSLDVYGNYIITGSWRYDNQLEMWDMREATPHPLPIKWEKEPGMSGLKVYSCQISKNNGRFLLAGGSGSNEARLFDFMQGANAAPAALANIRYLSKACYTVDFSAQTDLYAVSGSDGFIRLGDITKREP
jgi:WD40 repeat protein